MKVLQGILLMCFMMVQNIGGAFAQQSSVEQEVKDLSKNKWQWMADKDMTRLDDLFHAQSVYVHMGGSWGKQREMDVIRSGGIWYKKADIHEVSVEIVDDVAVLLNRIDLTAEVGGNEVVNPFIVTEVYRKEGKSWKLLSLSFTKILTSK